MLKTTEYILSRYLLEKLKHQNMCNGLLQGVNQFCSDVDDSMLMVTTVVNTFEMI